MSATVWKYELRPDVQELMMPKGAVALSVQAQFENPSIWALVDPSSPLESRLFVVVGTGHPLPHPVGVYVGTFQLQGGALVFHVFEGPARIHATLDLGVAETDG